MLTTLAQVKSHLSIQSSNVLEDIRLNIFINAASEFIEQYCDRLFEYQEHSEILNVDNRWSIMPSQWPIVSVTDIVLSYAQDFTNTAPMDPTSYFISDKATQISFIQSRARSRKSMRIRYFAGYQTIPVDLELACIWLVEWYYRNRQRADIGKTSMSKGDESIGILDQAPRQIIQILERYKRSEFGYYLGDAFA